MGPLGVPEMIFIFLLALLILGPKKLPELGRSIGKGMAEFRRASNELRGTFEREMTALERETEPIKQAASTYPSTGSSSTAPSSSYSHDGSYDYPYDDYSHSQEPAHTEAPAAASSPDSQPSTSSVSAPQAAEAQPAPHSGASSQHSTTEVKS
jgi:sec-independent protein translocase protein TatA